MRHSKLKVRSFNKFICFSRPSSCVRHPASVVPRPSSCGFTYIGLLVIIVVIGISLGAAGKYWQNVMLREKETELLYRGDQYRMAIEKYIAAVPGRRMYPQSVDELLKDPRNMTGIRHLRRKYKDPITGKDFVLIKDAHTRRIIGVRSESELEPLKQAGFPEHQKDFENKKLYSDWQFITTNKLPGTIVSTVVSPPAENSFDITSEVSFDDDNTSGFGGSGSGTSNSGGSGSGGSGGGPGGAPGGPGSAPSGTIPPEFQHYLDSLKQQQSQ